MAHQEHNIDPEAFRRFHHSLQEKEWKEITSYGERMLTCDRGGVALTVFPDKTPVQWSVVILSMGNKEFVEPYSTSPSPTFLARLTSTRGPHPVGRSLWQETYGRLRRHQHTREGGQNNDNRTDSGRLEGYHK